ncbi:MAG: 50S ribosomal protein L22 [Ilumatobacteraceae bacterium]|nr:50S ribosomal protein L22 [Ilumatobacteraceae bacterium]MBL6760032.1 50S ribosomal protein L22 [Ilumatobacteraceae bacterium]
MARAGERSGTKAVAKHVRSSAYKARVVLDLIRGLDVRRADEVLALTQRDIARDIRKVLRSAVANAVNNEGQDAEELFVVACFADEGTTLKRFRPRARGRATRIRKRTCHITVIVARMSDDRLEILRAKAEGASASAAAARRARVDASRRRAEAAQESSDQVEDDVVEGDSIEDVSDETVTEADAVEVADDSAEDAADDAAASDDESAEDAADDAADDTTEEAADESADEENN